jgi:hypothetical protein
VINGFGEATVIEHLRQEIAGAYGVRVVNLVSSLSSKRLRRDARK